MTKSLFEKKESIVTNYVPCGSCARHVRNDEPRCPFCDAAIKTRTPMAPRRPGRRLARLAGAALSAGVVASGCGSDSSSVPDGAPPVDAGNGVVVGDVYGLPPDSGVLDSGVIPGDVYGLPPDSGVLDSGVIVGDVYGLPPDAGEDAGPDAGGDGGS